VRFESSRTMRRAVLIGRCADPDNTWLSEIEDSHGQPFPAMGRKSVCGSRLCPADLKLLQKRSQQRLVEARNEFWKRNVHDPRRLERFVTLTGPTMQGMPLEDTHKLFNLAFQKLSDRAFWTSRVDGGAKHVEFTVTSRGYHTHIHLLIYGRYMERDASQEELSRAWRLRRSATLAQRNMRVVKDDLPPLGNLQREWTACLSEAAREFGREIEWSSPEFHGGWYSRLPDSSGEIVEVQPTSADSANVHVCKAREKGRPGKDEIGIHSAIKELTKYLTKASSWAEVSDEQLVEIAEVRRWPRCFELIGQWRHAKAAVVEQRAPVIYLKSNETWEEFCRRVSLAHGDPSSYVIAWDRLNASHSLYVATSGVDASLDTDFVNRSGCEEATESPPRKFWIKERAPSLMEIGEGMSFRFWLTMVSVRLANTRRVRKRQLTRKYPNAHFICLDGSEFGGPVRSASSTEPTMTVAEEAENTLRLAA
jgi:hypothetical protein